MATSISTNDFTQEFTGIAKKVLPKVRREGAYLVIEYEGQTARILVQASKTISDRTFSSR